MRIKAELAPPISDHGAVGLHADYYGPSRKVNDSD